MSRLWHEVAESVGLPQLAMDPRFATQSDRARNQEELLDLLAPQFTKRTAAEWLKEMDRRVVPCSMINTYGQILSDPQVLAMNLVRPLSLPNGVESRTTAFPVAMSSYEFKVYRQPPMLGEHTEEVFEEWVSSSPDEPTANDAPHRS